MPIFFTASCVSLVLALSFESLLAHRLLSSSTYAHKRTCTYACTRTENASCCAVTTATTQHQWDWQAAFADLFEGAMGGERRGGEALAGCNGCSLGAEKNIHMTVCSVARALSRQALLFWSHSFSNSMFDDISDVSINTLSPITIFLSFRRIVPLFLKSTFQIGSFSIAKASTPRRRSQS